MPTLCPYRAAKLSCLCAPEGSGTHTHKEMLSSTLKKLILFKNLPRNPSLNSPHKDGVQTEVGCVVSIGWVVLSVCYAQKNIIRALLAHNSMLFHLLT